jgi:hypothetical protein
VSAKLRQADYALGQIRSLATGEFTTGQSGISTALPGTSNEDRLHFYVDAFFAFLYSTFDVLGQVVNQAQGLGLKEKDASFKNVRNVLQNNASALSKKLVRVAKSRNFKKLEAYRNCSTHRRRIYIETTTVSGTSGYSLTPTVQLPKHLLADDPLALVLKPKVTNRELLAYCGSSLGWVQKEVQTLMKNL